MDPALIDILVCPQCRAGLSVDAAAQELVCHECALAYPIKSNSPVMLVDHARQLS